MRHYNQNRRFNSANLTRCSIIKIRIEASTHQPEENLKLKKRVFENLFKKSKNPAKQKEEFHDTHKKPCANLFCKFSGSTQLIN